MGFQKPKPLVDRPGNLGVEISCISIPKFISLVNSYTHMLSVSCELVSKSGDMLYAIYCLEVIFRQNRMGGS